MIAFRDDRVREYIFPVNIVKTYGNVENAAKLKDKHDLQVATCDKGLAVFKGKSYVILDFGNEIYGGLRILTKNCDKPPQFNRPCKIRIRFGESLSESCSELNEKNAGNDHATRDMHTIISSHSDMDFGNTGFRFVRIDFLDKDAVVLIKAFLAISVYRDIPYLGDFECSDSRINEIYRVARRTCHLNMQNMLWDGIKRDKLVWIGDMHPEMLTIKCVFGYDKCIEDGLNHAVNYFKLPEFINYKPSYSIWFVIILHDWYFQNNNIQFVKSKLSYVEELFNLLDKLVDEKGDTNFKGYFFDWPTHGSLNSNEGGSIESKIGVKSLFIIALDCAIELYKVFDKDTNFLIKLKKRLMSFSLPLAKSKQAAAFSVLSGQSEAEKYEELLLKNGAEGLSTFMSYYIFKVMSMCGQTDKAIEIMKDYYGGMLDKGATTFWEDFNIKWMKGSCRIDEFPKQGELDIHGDFGDFCYKGFRHSLCHGWSSGPVPYLTEFIAGIKVVQSSCRKIIIKPDLVDLTYVKCNYPTPFGLLSVEHIKKDGKIVSKYSAPQEIEVLLIN